MTTFRIWVSLWECWYVLGKYYDFQRHGVWFYFLNFHNFADTKTRGEFLSQEFIVSWETIVTDEVLPHASSVYPAGVPVFPNALPSVSEVHPLPGDHHLSLKMNAYIFVSLASSLFCPVPGVRRHFKNIYLSSLEQGEEAKADAIHSSAPAAMSFPKVSLAEFCTHLRHSCRLFLHGVCAFKKIHHNLEHTVCLH